MASITERLLLVISADGKQAVGEFRKLSQSAASEGAKTEGALRRLSGSVSATTFAAAAGAGGAVLAMGKSMAGTYEQAARQTLKFQRLTGATAEDSSRVRVVAQQTGVDVDKLGAAFVRLSKTADTSAGKKALEELGVSLTDANGKALPLKDQLLALSEGFSRSGNAAAKNKAAVALFGKSGADLLPLLNRGAKGLDELMAKADKLGLTMTDKDLGRVKDYIKAQRDLSLSFEGLKMQVGREIFPIVAGQMKVAANVATELVGAFTKLPDPVKQTGVAVVGLGATALTVFGSGGLMLKGVFAATDAYRQFGSKLSDTAMFSRLNGAIRDSEGNLTRFGSALKGLGAVALGAAVVGAVIEIGNAFNKASQDTEKFNASLQVLGGGKAGNQTKAFANLVNSLTGTLDTWSQQLDKNRKSPLGPAQYLDPGTAGTFVLNKMFGNDSDLVGKVKVGTKSMAVDLNQLGEAVDKLRDSGNIVAMKNALAELGRITPVNAEGKKEIAEQTERLRTMYKVALDAAAGERDMTAAAEKDTAARRAAGMATGEFAATAADLGDKIKWLDQVLKSSSATFDANQAAAKGWAAGIAQTSGLLASQMDAAQSVGSSMTAFNAAAKDLPRSIDLAAVSQGKLSDEQSKAIDAFQTLGASIQSQLGNQLAMGASFDQVRASAEGWRVEMDGVLQQLGINDQATRDYYLTLIGLDGTSVETAIKLSGVEQARSQLQFLQGDFDALPTEARSQIYALVAQNDWVGALNLYRQFQDKTVKVRIDVDAGFASLGIMRPLAAAWNKANGFASGGVVPGVGSRDTVPAMLTPGEFVVTKEATKHVGVDRLLALNAKAQHFALGGIVADQRGVVDHVVRVDRGGAGAPTLAVPAVRISAPSSLSVERTTESRAVNLTVNQYGVAADTSPTELVRAQQRAKALLG